MASALSGAGDRFERRGLGVVRGKIELPRFRADDGADL